MATFELESKYSVSQDQKNSISSLLEGIQKGNDKQTLLGVTGSGKTFVMANIIKELDRPALILSHNKRHISLPEICT